MATTLSIALLATLCGMQIALLMLAVRTWQKVCALPGPEAVRLLDELRRRLDALERAVDRRPPAGRTVRTRQGRSQRIDASHVDAVPGPTLIAVPNLANASDPTPSVDELGQRFGPIWSLADAGLTAEVIAERTGQPIGQVELILGLRRHAGVVRSIPSSTRKRD